MNASGADAQDTHWMRLALAQAQTAAQAGEVPVGALVVHAGAVIASGHNQPIARHDPCAHAEIIALRAAAAQQGNYRLEDCTLYVTLEPCPMCAGALLQARVQRVVFGATDPKTGAAGSVTNLFAMPQLNHQTQVQGGVLAEDCAAVLQGFFQTRRAQKRLEHQPVREDVLRTPDSVFAALSDYPWAPHYVHDLPALQGLRLHYLDEGPQDAPLTWLCLHDRTRWSYLYRHLLTSLVAAGQHVVVPDWIGFGKSDKPKKESHHTLAWHRQVLQELVQRLDLQRVVVVEVEGDALSAQGRFLLPSGRCRGLLQLQLTDAAEPSDHDNLPFPDPGHRAALRALAKTSSQDLPALNAPGWSDRTLRLQTNIHAEPDAAMALHALNYFQPPP